ncbi:MAG: guanylate kinase [Oligoflexia bacterium]|nr:guanylate kinase [Oligoflexia bacterium]
MSKLLYQKKLIALASPSGGGKTTLCKKILSKYENTSLSISHTTRDLRSGEKDGKDYFFVSRDQFEKLIQEGNFIEWAEVHGNLYGTSKTFIDDQVTQRKIIVLDIDVQGVESLKNIYGNDCLSIFIMPPSLEELKQRLIARKTETQEKIEKRMQAAKEEMSQAKKFDYQLVNVHLEDTFSNLCDVLEREFGITK